MHKMALEYSKSVFFLFLVLIIIKFNNGQKLQHQILYRCPNSSNDQIGNRITFPPSLSRTKEAVIYRVPKQIRRLRCNSELVDFVMYKPTTVDGLQNRTGKNMEMHDDVKIDTNGYLKVDIEWYPPTEFCIERDTPSAIHGKYCVVDCESENRTHACIPKCCGYGKVFDFKQHSCNYRSTPWEPLIYDEHNFKGCGKTRSDLKHHFYQASPNCHGSLVPRRKAFTKDGEPVTSERFRLLDNGNVAVSLHDEWKILEPGDVCIDAMDNYTLYSNTKFKNDPLDIVIYVCRVNPVSNNKDVNVTDPSTLTYRDEEPSNWKSIFLAVLMIICSIFLLCTAIIYILTWEKSNIHNWTVFSFVTAMLFMYIFLACAHLIQEFSSTHVAYSFGCTFVAVAGHFFFLSMFCWMTMLSLNFWLTFRNLSPTGDKRKSIPQYTYYAIFAFGVPALIMFFGLIVDKVFKPVADEPDECEPAIIIPEYGRSCFLLGKARSYYLYIPITLLMLCNILLYSSTVFLLWTYKKTTRNVNTAQKQNKESIVLYTKLFFVNGMFWIFEIISWAVHMDNDTNDQSIIWLFFDCVNLLQSIFIFIIFTCKKENAIFFWKKYPKTRRFLKIITKFPEFEMPQMDDDGTRFSAVSMSKIQS